MRTLETRTIEFLNKTPDNKALLDAFKILREQVVKVAVSQKVTADMLIDTMNKKNQVHTDNGEDH